MGVSVIAESGLEMTKLNDLREDDKGKILKNQNYPDYCYEKVYILPASMGFINITLKTPIPLVGLYLLLILWTNITKKKQKRRR